MTNFFLKNVFIGLLVSASIGFELSGSEPCEISIEENLYEKHLPPLLYSYLNEHYFSLGSILSPLKKETEGGTLMLEIQFLESEESFQREYLVNADDLDEDELEELKGCLEEWESLQDLAWESINEGKYLQLTYSQPNSDEEWKKFVVCYQDRRLLSFAFFDEAGADFVPQIPLTSKQKKNLENFIRETILPRMED